MRKETIRFCRLDREGGADIPLPSYESNSAAGMDICAGVAGETVVRPGERVLIPTGLAVALPEGFEVQVRPRSGLAVQYGVTVLNSPGTIDADYRGEIKILLINLGTENFVVRRSDRIAQLIVAPVIRANIELVDQLDITERGSGGFGHTGI